VVGKEGGGEGVASRDKRRLQVKKPTERSVLCFWRHVSGEICRELVRFECHSSQLSGTKAGQKVVKSWTRTRLRRNCKLQISNFKMMGRGRLG